MSDSFSENAAGAARVAMALKRIIAAFTKGGLKGAAVEAVKSFLPYVLIIVAVFVGIPLIVVSSLPSMLLSSKPTVSEYEHIREMCVDRLCQQAGDEYEDAEICVVGQPMSEDEIYAVALVLSDNDTKNVTDEFLAGCICDSVVTETVMGEKDTKIETVNIRYLPMEEFLRLKGRNDADIEWAKIILQDLQENFKEDGDVLNERTDGSDTD